ncbi:hypothetical protein [Corynebacterium variabile]|uniref:hypothetical protein n=1 Tax=Corynebacterium variabile TaxID=1727 RepID=UPI003F9A5D10
MRLPRPLSRLIPLAVSAALGACLMSPVSPAAAQDAQEAPAPTTSDLLWANPDARSAEPGAGVTAQVTSQSAARAAEDEELEVTVSVTNGSDQTLTGLELRAQHAETVAEPDGVATSLLANQGEYPWAGPFQTLDATVGPGESLDITVRVPVGQSDDWYQTDADATGATADDVTLPGLGLSGAGVHPLLFNLNGSLGDADISYLAGARTTLTVTEDTDTDTDNQVDEDSGDSAPGLTVLWPLSSASVAVAGQVGDAPDPSELYLPDETLAGELSEGGRLRGLLDTWRDATDGDTTVKASTCLAIDPDLLETVDRMTDGYRVGATVPSPVQEPTRLRDRWNRHDDDAPSESGTGADAASAWLSDLRDVVKDACVVPLPYANADINAVATGNDPWLAEEMTDRGVSVVEDVLDITPATGIQIPGSGYIEPAARSLISGKDGNSPSTAVIADATLDRGTVESGGDEITRSATGTLPDSPMRTLQFPAALGSALAATGVRPETAAYSDTSSRRDLAADGAASRMAAAVGVLDRELNTARTTTGQVLAVPPAAWSVDPQDATTFLDAVRDHFADGSAEPVSFGDALSAPAAPVTLDDSTENIDPSPVDDGAARNVAQVAGHLRNLTNIMEDVPNIALTRRIFTRPMFDDLLRAVSDTGRRFREDAAAVRNRGSERTGQVTGLAYALRTSVSLLPPGNVFTRTSDSSPLIVVARNGLPLPVSVRVHYAGAPGVTLNTPGVQQIPAQGSVTLQMTSEIPTEAEQSDLTMYLSTPDDVRISDEVTIRLASVPGLNWRLVGIVAACLVLIFVAARTLRKRRRAVDGSPDSRRVKNDGARD